MSFAQNFTGSAFPDHTLRPLQHISHGTVTVSCSLVTSNASLVCLTVNPMACSFCMSSAPQHEYLAEPCQHVPSETDPMYSRTRESTNAHKTNTPVSKVFCQRHGAVWPREFELWPVILGVRWGDNNLYSRCQLSRFEQPGKDYTQQTEFLFDVRSVDISSSRVSVQIVYSFSNTLGPAFV